MRRGPLVTALAVTAVSTCLRFSGAFPTSLTALGARGFGGGLPAQRASAESQAAVMSSLLLVEHLNLNVECTEKAKAFYLEGLGCQIDELRASKFNAMHVNVGGMCQFHTAGPENEPAIKEEGSQIWRGAISIVYPTQEACDTAVQRLERIKGTEVMAQSKLALRPAAQGGASLVTCPFGNSFLLRQAVGAELHGLGPSVGQRASSDKSAPLGVASISLTCPAGTAKHIATFYSSVLGMAVGGEDRRAVVSSASGAQTIQYVEVGAGEELPKYTGDHLCVYVSDYEAVFERCLAAGVVWVNPRFTHLDKSETLEEAWHYKQFRFKDIPGPDGTVIYTQEHEVRTIEHPSCPINKQ